MYLGGRWERLDATRMLGEMLGEPGLHAYAQRDESSSAYYVVSESLANVAKYARATAVSIQVGRRDGQAVVEVADDGIGGADGTRGSGLRGLRDRVEALGGRFSLASPPAAGQS